MTPDMELIRNTLYCTKLKWSENWKELFPEANKHEVDMLEGKYGSYAKGGLMKQIEEGRYIRNYDIGSNRKNFRYI